WFASVVRRAHLNAQGDALVVLFGQVKDQLQILGQRQPTGTQLNLPPSRPYIELLAQGKSEQVFGSCSRCGSHTDFQEVSSLHLKFSAVIGKTVTHHKNIGNKT